MKRTDKDYEACKSSLLAGGVSFATGEVRGCTQELRNEEGKYSLKRQDDILRLWWPPSGTGTCCERILPRVKCGSHPRSFCRGPLQNAGKVEPATVARDQGLILAEKQKALKESHRASTCSARFCRSTCASRLWSQSAVLLGSRPDLGPSCCFAFCCDRRRLFVS